MNEYSFIFNRSESALLLSAVRLLCGTFSLFCSLEMLRSIRWRSHTHLPLEVVWDSDVQDELDTSFNAAAFSGSIDLRVRRWVG